MRKQKIEVEKKKKCRSKRGGNFEKQIRVMLEFAEKISQVLKVKGDVVYVDI